MHVRNVNLLQIVKSDIDISFYLIQMIKNDLFKAKIPKYLQNVHVYMVVYHIHRWIQSWIDNLHINFRF